METYDDLLKSGRLVVNAVHKGSRRRSYNISLHLDRELIEDYSVEWDDDWEPDPYTPDGEQLYLRWVRSQKTQK